jgi:hypothetical protein
MSDRHFGAAEHQSPYNVSASRTHVGSAFDYRLLRGVVPNHIYQKHLIVSPTGQAKMCWRPFAGAHRLVSLLLPRGRSNRALLLADLPQAPRGLSVPCLGARRPLLLVKEVCPAHICNVREKDREVYLFVFIFFFFSATGSGLSRRSSECARLLNLNFSHCG